MYDHATCRQLAQYIIAARDRSKVLTAGTLAALGFWPRTRNSLFWLAVYALLIAAIVVLVFPVYWMVSTSLKTPGEMFARNISLIPRKFTFQNYINVWTQTDFAIFFWNSFKVATESVVFTRVRPGQSLLPQAAE